MWNKKRSLTLSKLCTLLFMAVLVGLLVAAPWAVEFFTGYSIQAQGAYRAAFLATVYTGGVAAGALLYNLYRLLHNIGKDIVFTQRNISLLRRISWLCIVGGGICAVSALYYVPWLIVTAAAAFIGLIVRVVKNIFAAAVAMKEEQDYTI